MESVNKKLALFVLFIILGVVLIFQNLDDRYDFDEEEYIRNSLSKEGYEVINVELKDKTIISEVKNPNDKLTFGNITSIMMTQRSAYDTDYWFINHMPKKELRKLGINYKELKYMSNAELKEVEDIVARRASFFVVKTHTPGGVCSYKLSKDTQDMWYETWETCFDVNCEDHEARTSALQKIVDEIESSETCS